MFVDIKVVYFYSDVPQTTNNKAINDLCERLDACILADDGTF